MERHHVMMDGRSWKSYVTLGEQVMPHLYATLTRVEINLFLQVHRIVQADNVQNSIVVYDQERSVVVVLDVGIV